MVRNSIDPQLALEEVMQALRAARGDNPFDFDMFKSQLQVLHVPRPLQKQISGRGFSFSQLSPAELKPIWRHIWSHSGVLEARLQVLSYYRGLSQKHLHGLRGELYFFARDLDNWCESDYLSELLAELHEYAPGELQPKLATWNKSRDPWLRRQSVVSLFYYQRLRRIQPPIEFVLQQLASLLEHPEHYVQKGVGWTLREALQVYPEATYAFVDEHITRLSASAFATVMEKTDTARKHHYKQVRKQSRQLRSK